MAHKRIFIYAVIVAICYLVGVTWAETALQSINNGSSIAAQQSSTIPVAPATQEPTNAKSNNAAPAPAPAPSQPPPSPPQKAVTAAPDTKANNSTTTAKPDCVCGGALLPHADELPICPECKCKHLARNTTLIKVVVIIVIWIISILVIYMLFLMCLDPLLNKRVKANYQEHTNEDDEPTPPMPSSGNQELNSRANVLNRVGHQQDKWKRQVREQRRHIYDRHTMLN